MSILVWGTEDMEYTIKITLSKIKKQEENERKENN